MTQALADGKSTPLADGRVHSVKVQYFPYIKYNVLPHFSAAPPLIPFLKDAGEDRRVGTLLVFVDDMTTPLVAMPFNLNVAMRMPQGQAWIVRVLPSAALRSDAVRCAHPMRWLAHLRCITRIHRGLRAQQAARGSAMTSCPGTFVTRLAALVPSIMSLWCSSHWILVCRTR